MNATCTRLSLLRSGQAALSNQATFPDSINLPAKSFNCRKVTLESNSTIDNIEHTEILEARESSLNAMRVAFAAIVTTDVALNLFERLRSDWPDITRPAGVVLALERNNRSSEVGN